MDKNTIIGIFQERFPTCHFNVKTNNLVENICQEYLFPWQKSSNNYKKTSFLYRSHTRRKHIFITL